MLIQLLTGYKILKVVRFNSSEAIVVNKMPEIKYEKHGQYLFGEDRKGMFCSSFRYEAPSKYSKAFGGEEFDILMKDGSVLKANGQWWLGGTLQHEKHCGKKIISVTIRDIESLKKCYVFCGLGAFEENYKKLRKSYKGEIFGYWEYEALLNNRQSPLRKDGVKSKV